MGETQHMPEIVFTFTALDDSAGPAAEAAFGKDNVSASKRMTGGMPYEVFIKPLVEILGKLLAWRARQAKKIANAKLRIGKNEINLEGYGADDAERLLNSEGFQQALAKLRQ
jgi:hypothetical protein